MNKSGGSRNLRPRIELSIDTCVRVDHGAKGERLEHPLAGQNSQRRYETGFVESSSHCLGQRQRIARREGKAGALDDFSEASNRRGNHKTPTSHLFESSEARSFFHDRRDHHGSHIAEFVLQGRTRKKAGDSNARLQMRGGDLLFQARALGTVSDEQDLHLSPFRAKQTCGIQQNGNALFDHQPTQRSKTASARRRRFQIGFCGIQW
jgi:hypothetical protein